MLIQRRKGDSKHWFKSVHINDPLLLRTFLAFRERIMNWWIFAISSFSLFALTSGGEEGK